MENGNRRNLYLVTLSVSITMMTLGLSSGWSMVVLPKFQNNQTDVDIDKYGMSAMVSTNPGGFAVGAIICWYISDKIGRRVTILASAFPIVAGSIIIAFAVNAWQVCITSFLWGWGSGMISTVINIYMTEIADKDVRGQLAIFTGFMFKFGHLLIMIVGPFMSYKNLNLLMFALPCLYFVICWWIPETPYFCLKNNDQEGARKSLRILRGYKDDEKGLQVLEDELLSLQEDVKKQMLNSSSVKELFVGAQYRKAIIISAGLKLTALMTGAMVLKQYLALIVKDTQLNLDDSLVSIIYGSITFVVSMMSSLLVDRVGRRPLLVYSYLGTGASLFIVGLFFFFRDVLVFNDGTLITLAFIPFTGIILSNVISTFGFSSLIHVVPAEIFPINVKAIAFTCLSLFSSALAVVVSITYQAIKDLGGLTTVFWLYASFAIAGSVFSYFFVIETKGKCLSVIQKELQGVKYDAGAADPMMVAEKLEKITSNDEKVESNEMQELGKKDTV